MKIFQKYKHIQYHKYHVTFDGKIYRISQPHEIQHSIIAEAKYKDKLELIEINRHLDEDCELKFIQYQDERAQRAFQLSCGFVVASVIKHFYKCEISQIGATNINSSIKIHKLKKSLNDKQSINELNHHLIDRLQNIKHFERALIPPLEIQSMVDESQLKLINTRTEFQAVYKYGDFFSIIDGPLLPDTQLIKKIVVTDVQQDIVNAQGTINQDAYEAFLNTKYLHEDDHRHIGRKQNLFFFNKYAPGSAFFLEKGTIIYNKLQNFLRNEYRKRGFKEVQSPQLFNKDLWKISGHLDNYASNIYFIEEMGLKPMNCPGHCLIYESQLHNSKELPIRYAEFGNLHRNEVHGSLSGLTRLRKFCQDDAHIFCRPDQIEQEINSAIEFLDFVYKKLGFKYSLLLSTRPDEYIGTDTQWDEAERQLVKALDGRDYKVNAKDGAFYGPKIDVMIKDAMGKEHQCGTIQLDFNLPERFDLQFQQNQEYIRPVMIHRAILGSMERMIGILTEQYQGRWPFWLSPRQVMVISIDVNDYAQGIRDKLHNAGFDVDLDTSSRSVGKKVREAQEYHYNYIVVVGKKEKEDNILTVRELDQKLQYEEFLPNDPIFVQLETPIPISDFVNQVKKKDIEKEFGILRSYTETKLHEQLYVKSTPKIEGLNRYSNIIPYQHSLVSDHPQFYINANYIKDFHGNDKQFIATQGPKKETVGDFWHMIWVNKVQVIVMLCNLCEKGRSQCEQYWPNLGDQQINGNYQVNVIGQQKQKDLVENTIVVKNQSQEFKLKQLWWQGWPDFGVPAENSFPLIDQITETLIQSQKNGGKPVVHCSAGVGRTGTILSMCYVKEALKSGQQAISIFSFVRKLREQRPLMVNTAEQYALIYKYALWLLQK